MSIVIAADDSSNSVCKVFPAHVPSPVDRLMLSGKNQAKELLSRILSHGPGSKVNET